jgi:hypothetical protein
VFAAALPDGHALAVKVLDGAARPVPAIVAAALRELGAGSPAVDDIGLVPVLGHGVPVGEVRAHPIPATALRAPDRAARCSQRA